MVALPGPLEISNPYLATAVDAVAAAASIQQDQRDNIEIQAYKNDTQDIVTNIDHAAETEMRWLISNRHPDHKIIGEEHDTHLTSPDLTGNPTWLLDPIDGTVNYFHGLPPYCAIAAFIEDCTIKAAAVYDTYHDDLYYAASGEGVYRNRTRLEVSDTPSLDTALISYDILGRHLPNTSVFELHSQLMQSAHTRKVVCNGLIGGYLASGNVDGLLELGAEPWDIASLILFTREAGGTVTTQSGDTDWESLRDGYFVASNGEIHSELLDLYESVDTSELNT